LCKRMWGVRGRPLAFMTSWFHNQGGKAVGPSKDAVRGTVNQVYMPPLLLAHLTNYDSIGYGSHIANGPTIAEEHEKAQGSKAKPDS
jgi:hypothetical protein